MMQQNRDRNGRPRNTRPYDLNRDVARTSAPSQNHNTPRSTGSSRYGYNGEPLSRPPSRSANGSVRSSRADNSIQFPTQPQSQTRRPAQGQGSNTTQYPAGSRPAGSRPKNAKSGGKQRRPANNARSGQNNRNNQNHPNAQNHPNRQQPAGSQSQRLRPAQSAPQQSPARREMRKKRKVTRATLRRRRMLRRLTAFAMLPVLAVAAAQKGYILPVCLTLVYTFLGFILLMVNMYLHPLSSMTAIVMRDIPGVVITQPLNIPGAFLCIGVWGVASVLLAGAALKKRK